MSEMPNGFCEFVESIKDLPSAERQIAIKKWNASTSANTSKKKKALVYFMFACFIFFFIIAIC